MYNSLFSSINQIKKELMDAETLNLIQHRLDGLNERHQALRGYL